MKILLTCAGDSDPIRNYHDGSLLHISRVERPDKVVIFHSDHSLKRHEKIVKAIEAISDDYSPEIIAHPQIIDSVEYFDQTFQQLKTMMDEYLNTEDDFLLNLSSGTPQMKSAFFTVNQIYDYKFKSIRVSTPVRGSNQGIGHESQEDIELLIMMNEDQNEDFTNRCVIEHGERFHQSLVKRNIRLLVESYDYAAALALVKETVELPNRQILLSELNCLVNDINTQSLPAEIEKLSYDKNLKKALFAYLLLSRSLQQNEMAIVLIRVKSLTEYLMNNYLKEKYSKLFNGNYVNMKEYKKYVKKVDGRINYELEYEHLNIHRYRQLLDSLESDNEALKTELLSIIEINKTRNRIAHSLDQLEEYDYQKIRKSVLACRQILELVYQFDERLLDYYDEINKELLTYLE